MNKRIKLILITTIFVLGALLINHIQHKNKELHTVNLKDKTDKKSISILVNDGSDNYVEFEGDTFPLNTEYTYNSELSKCQDRNGNIIEDILSYDDITSKLSVKTMKTIFCYLYFDKLISFANELIDSGLLWQSGLEKDGHRYTGSGNATASTSPKNFVCFGTNNLSECKTNEDKYMYRIIGIFPNEEGTQHLKLIKYKRLGAYMWHSNSETDVLWESSDLYKGLNGEYYLNNITYSYLQDTKWLNKIADWKWSAPSTGNPGVIDYGSITTQEIYLNEMTDRGTYPRAKIGLMYASDYQMSLGSSTLTMTGSSNSATLKSGWMHISNNDTSASSIEEWLISCRGFHNKYNMMLSWKIGSNGAIGDDYVNSDLSARPVFYLNSNVLTTGGNGSYSNPYLLQE